MKEFNQLTLEERKKLYKWKLDGMKVRAIACKLSRAKSTIYNELKRNCIDKKTGYLPDSADQIAKSRKARHGTKIEKNPELKSRIVESLAKKISPEAIAGRLKAMQFPFLVSHETVYKYIYGNEGKKLGLYKFLCKGRTKRGQLRGRKVKKSLIPDRVSIHDRPLAIATRDEFGHQEGDLTFFTGNQSINLTVIIERKTRFVRLILNASKHAVDVMAKMFNTLAQLPIQARKSITFDNGVEFVRHTLLKTHMNMQTYFCDKHSPWQKGQVEQMNSMIHRYLPKNFSIKNATEDLVQNVQDMLNNLPRKCLGYKTPAEAYNDEILKLVSLQT